MIKLKNTYNKYASKFEEKECKLTTTWEEFQELRNKVDRPSAIKVKYIASCGHYNTICIISFIRQDNGRKCKGCILLDELLQQYNKWYKFFKENNCTVTTSFKEFQELYEKSNNLSSKINIKYIASCGHSNNIVLSSFQQGNGIKCRKCIRTQIKDTSKNSDGSSKNVKLEDDGIEFLINELKYDFDIKLTVEGCLADFAIKPVNIIEDHYLQVQLKTTQKPKKDIYSFALHNNKYTDHLLICLCLTDLKIWLFNGNDIDITGISVSKNSKYIQNEIKGDLIQKIRNFWNILPKVNWNKINTPIADNSKKEQEFRKFREQMCNKIIFNYPMRHCLVWDFKINNKKIQEKVGYLDKYNGVIFNLRKTNNGIQKQPYDQGDNDFYWLNYPDKEHFLIIPEKFVIDKKSIYVRLDKQNQWYSQYIYKYSNIDQEQILNIFL